MHINLLQKDNNLQQRRLHEIIETTYTAAMYNYVQHKVHVTIINHITNSRKLDYRNVH